MTPPSQPTRGSNPGGGGSDEQWKVAGRIGSSIALPLAKSALICAKVRDCLRAHRSIQEETKSFAFNDADKAGYVD
jgi:hypothetical protein